MEAFSLCDNLHRNTLFIVDEASMLSGNRDNTTFGSGCLLDDLVKYVYSGSNCSLLLLGDDAQLPPVGSLSSPALDEAFMASYGLHVSGFGLQEVARQALDSGILSEATRLRQEIQNSKFKIQNLSIQPNGRDIIKVPGEEVIDTLEQSWRTVGAEETLIIARSNKMTNL